MRIQIEPKYFNAVMIAAGKGDVREYLNGFYVDFERNVVVGTDGHRLITVPYGTTFTGKKPANIIYSRYGANGLLGNTTPIPQKFKAHSVFVDTLKNTLQVQNEKGMIVLTERLARVDAKFPEYTRVMAGPSDLEDATPDIAFNSLLVSGLQRALDCCVVKFSFHKDFGPINLTFQDHPAVHCTLMPCRMG
jgi:DNA polymerase III sliding clamp (beta) subunit (PCNA family)